MTTPSGSTTRGRALITLGGAATSFAALALFGVGTTISEAVSAVRSGS